MSNGFPSMTALLGLLAVAGYQNRDKIAEMLRGAGSSNPGTPSAQGSWHRLQRNGTIVLWSRAKEHGHESFCS